MSYRILLYHLEEEVARELRDALISSRIVPSIEDGESSSPMRWDEVDLVFCSSDPTSLLNLLEATCEQRPRLQVVAASRLPDVNEWLNSLEAGASDYCAAPFESKQIQWLLATYLSRNTQIAA